MTIQGRHRYNFVCYSTQEVKRGDLTVIVTATGTLQATNEVDVSSELSGIIKTVEADYNSRVRKGQVLARLGMEPDRRGSEGAGLPEGIGPVPSDGA